MLPQFCKIVYILPSEFDVLFLVTNLHTIMFEPHLSAYIANTKNEESHSVVDPSVCSGSLVHLSTKDNYYITTVGM